MSMCPDFLRNKALARNIPDEEADALWEQHTKWCDQNGKDYGGILWDKLLDAVVRRMSEARVLGDKDAQRAAEALRRRRLEEQAKAVADAAYAREAVSLRQWLQTLRHQEQDGEALVPHERLLARAEPPEKDEDAAEWIAAALARARRHDGAPVPRSHDCPEPGCGLAVSSWVSPSGHRYHASRCVDHRRTGRE